MESLGQEGLDSSRHTDGAEPTSSPDDSDREKVFSERGDRSVFCLRMSVLAILFFSAAAVSVAVYFLTSSGEEDSFEVHYEAAATKVKGKSAQLRFQVNLLRHK